MTDVKQLITEHLDIWLTAEAQKKSGRGRSSGLGDTIYGIKKLRKLILNLALDGKLIKTSSKWNSYTLDEVGSWAIGSAFPKIAQGLQNEEILFCKVSDMNLEGNEKYITYTNNSISLEQAQQLKTKVHLKGTVIFPKIGGAIATNKRRILIKPTAIDNNCLGITPFEFIDPEWLYLLLRNIDFTEYQAGTSVPALQQAKIAKIKVYAPSLEDQKKVINEIKKYRDLCDQLEEQQNLSSDAHATLVDTLLKALTESSDAEEFQANWQRIVTNFDLLFTTDDSIEQLKQSILQLAVMGKLVKQDPSDEPASELLKQIAEEKAKLIKEGKIKKSKPLPEIGEDEKQFELPNGWEWIRFNDLSFNVSTGPFGSLIHKSDYVKNGIPLINPSHMINGKIEPDYDITVSEKFAKEVLASYVMNEGDMVMARRGEVGRVAFVSEKKNCWICCSGSFVASFSKKILRDFLFILFQSQKIREYLVGEAIGMTMVNLNHSILLKMPIAIPSTEVQQKTVNQVNQLFSMIEQLQALQSKLQKTKLQLADALVANAVEGV